MTLWPCFRPVASVRREPSGSTRMTSKDWHGGRSCNTALVPLMATPPVNLMFPDSVRAIGPRSRWLSTAYSDTPSRTVTVAA